MRKCPRVRTYLKKGKKQGEERERDRDRGRERDGPRKRRGRGKTKPVTNVDNSPDKCTGLADEHFAFALLENSVGFGFHAE